MSTRTAPATPLVLLVDDQEWTSRSIESILRPKGHVVVKAYTGQQALELVEKVTPDVALVDFHLPDLDGVEVARELRKRPTIGPVTPLLMISTSNVNRAARLEALGAGVWDILCHPVDPSELVLRIETFSLAKQEADRIQEQGLCDPVTGFYNARGLIRRAREIGADAVRSDRPMACLAIGPQWFGPENGEPSRPADPQLDDASLAEILRTLIRESDTVGRLDSGEFVIVAPGTDRDGALRLIDRFMESVQDRRHGAGSRADWLRAGMYATDRQESVVPEELLYRATTALRRAQADDQGTFLRSYEA